MLTRREALAGGVAVAGGLLLPSAGLLQPESAAALTGTGQTAWAVNQYGLVVPPSTWVKVPWPTTLLNTTVAHVESDGTWILPRSTPCIYQMLANIAWDNAFFQGVPIAPPTHRKLARIVQQNVGSNQAAYLGACTDLTYVAELALLGDQDKFSDGTKGYQQQQVNVQAGVRAANPDQRTWVEVYQNSGMTLMCPFDGSNAPMTPTRPRMLGLQAPSLMLTKVCDL